MNETLRTKIEEHCQMVSRGAKSLSIIPHQEKYYDEIVDIIESHNLYWQSQIISNGWRSVFIYKNKTIKYLIEELPITPKTPAEHALIGYMLGYDTNSICDYIKKECELSEPNIF